MSTTTVVVLKPPSVGVSEWPACTIGYVRIIEPIVAGEFEFTGDIRRVTREELAQRLLKRQMKRLGDPFRAMGLVFTPWFASDSIFSVVVRPHVDPDYWRSKAHLAQQARERSRMAFARPSRQRGPAPVNQPRRRRRRRRHERRSSR